MWQELIEIAQKMEQDDSVRVVVVTGAGSDAFSAGADIGDFEEFRSNSQQARVYAEAFEGALDAFGAMSKPSIAMIRGYCLGGACELTTALDLRIASENSRFAVPVARMGILVGYKEMRRLIQLLGVGNARYLLLTGRQFWASEMLNMGLVNIVVADNDLEDSVKKLALEIAGNAPLSHQGHKRIWEQVLDNPSLSGLSDSDVDFQLANFDSEDFREARTAFMEKRPPVFKGK
jgi:enoyl-CoA hydratase/carnithine racemase